MIRIKPDEYFDNLVSVYINRGNGIKMGKIAKNKFQYIAPNLQANIETYLYVSDTGLITVGGEDCNARIIRINGIELTDIRNDPDGNTYKVAYFTIREDGTVEQ